LRIEDGVKTEAIRPHQNKNLSRTRSARFFAGVREKDRATIFQIKTLTAVGFLEEAFHFPGSGNQLIDFGYLAPRE
jgi:hypothetical protein